MLKPKLSALTDVKNMELRFSSEQAALYKCFLSKTPDGFV